MQKQAPTAGRLALMSGFAMSCVAILIFLWLTFGGPLPIVPEGYRVQIRFPEATNLADETEVRISGVPVGRVREKKPDGALTRVEIELDDEYAPLPSDSRAVLRQKTLLGETYVELSPGTRGAPKLAEGATLMPGQVSDTVQLDEIFRAFDEPTRTAFRTWLDQQGRAVGEHGRDLSDALGNLAPFAEDGTKLLETLDAQAGATRQLVSGTGEVFDALTERRGQLRDLIADSGRAFRSTASRDQQLADTFRALPTFLGESRQTVQRITRFARETDPLITQLRPAARELSPTLIDLRALAPDLRGLFRDLDPLITASREGFPATERFLDDTRPLLGQLEPFLRNVNPILDWLGLYKREIAAFFSNSASATQATDLPGGVTAPVHYLRTTNPLNPEVLAAYPRRLRTNRSNPYFEPSGYDKLSRGLEVFARCGDAEVPPLNPKTKNRVPQSTLDLIERFIYTPEGPKAPSCDPQAPLGRVLGQPGQYPHVEEAPGR